jgi:phospholipid/cholesterol/gamma-HCH transport system substrate-binding protein
LPTFVEKHRTMEISKYTKLGLLIVFVIAALIWGLSYLKGHDFFKSTQYYHVIYDRVEGLAPSDAVTLNGYQVGQVKSIYFTDDGSGNLLVTFSIEGDLKIPVHSVARIVSSDIMGTKSIKLIYNPNEQVYAPNDTLPGVVESDLKEQVSMQVLPLKSKAEQLLATIDSAITILTVIFNEDARDNLSESFANINQTISNIEATSVQLNELIERESENIGLIVQNINVATENFKNKSEELSILIDNLAAVSDSLASIPYSPLVHSITNAVNQINEIVVKLNSPEGSVGMLLNDTELYDNLLALTENLDRLSRDIRLNPKRYVSVSAIDFGKEIYIAPPQDKIHDAIIFRVNLVSSAKRMPLNSPSFDGLGPIEETVTGDKYHYRAGETHEYNEILDLYERATVHFPGAEIIAFKNGNQIKLERAIRILQR